MIQKLGLEMDYKKYEELYYIILNTIRSNPNLKIAIRNTHDEIVQLAVQKYFASLNNTQKVN